MKRPRHKSDAEGDKHGVPPKGFTGTGRTKNAKPAKQPMARYTKAKKSGS